MPALTEMQRIFFPHPYLTKLTVALAHCFLEHDRDGEPVFLVLLYFRAVISGVGFVSCGQSYIPSSTIKFVYILWILQSIVDVYSLAYFDPKDHSKATKFAFSANPTM